jgi:hypothetical protein
MDSQVRTILLLAVVGLAVYYLMPQEQEPAVVEANEDVPELESVEESTTDVVMPEAEDVAPEVPVAAPTEEPVQMDNSDLVGMSDETGASLDSAFMGAVPPNTATDAVDFNRNNVTEYDSSSFLPQEVNDEWFDTDFTKAKYTLNDDKMINTNRYMIGVNTVGQSLKNPAYDIRGTIPNPKYTVSPWNNSTYEPDTNIKALY